MQSKAVARLNIDDYYPSICNFFLQKEKLQIGDLYCTKSEKSTFNLVVCGYFVFY